MSERHTTLRLVLSSMAALAMFAMVGCSSMRSEPTGVAIGEGRQQACQRACAAATSISPKVDAEASPERCEPCDCDQLAGKPAICTTTVRTRIP